MMDETLALLLQDRNGDHGTIRVLHIKGDQSPIVGLDVGVWAVIGRRLNRPNEPECKSRHPRFFYWKYSLSPIDMYAQSQTVDEETGIFWRVHSDGPRHTHPLESDNEDGPTSLPYQSRWVNQGACGYRPVGVRSQVKRKQDSPD